MQCNGGIFFKIENNYQSILKTIVKLSPTKRSPHRVHKDFG